MVFWNSIVNGIKTCYHDSIAWNVLHGAEFSYGSLRMPYGYEKRRNNTRKSRKKNHIDVGPYLISLFVNLKKTVMGFKSVLLETY